MVMFIINCMIVEEGVRRIRINIRYRVVKVSIKFVEIEVDLKYFIYLNLY